MLPTPFKPIEHILILALMIFSFYVTPSHAHYIHHHAHFPPILTPTAHLFTSISYPSCPHRYSPLLASPPFLSLTTTLISHSRAWSFAYPAAHHTHAMLISIGIPKPPTYMHGNHACMATHGCRSSTHTHPFKPPYLPMRITTLIPMQTLHVCIP